MNRSKTVATALCILGLALAGLALFLSEFHAYWRLVVLWSGGWLIVLLRPRRPLAERSRRGIDSTAGGLHEVRTPPARPDGPQPEFRGPHGA